MFLTYTFYYFRSVESTNICPVSNNEVLTTVSISNKDAVTLPRYIKILYITKIIFSNFECVIF